MKGGASRRIKSLWLIGQEVITFAIYASSILWAWIVGMLLLGVKAPMAGYTVFIVTCFMGASMFLCIVEPVARNKICGTEDIQIEEDDKVYLKFKSIKLTILRGWGILFRTIFISLIGIAGYHWIDPQPIGITPLLDLTLRQFLSNLFASVLALGCVIWLLSFPKQTKPDNSYENAYARWGVLGVCFIGLTTMAIFLGGVLLMLLQEAMK